MLIGKSEEETYKVVAFIVTVRVVEKNVKSSVGSENVASLRTKYKMTEMTCRTDRISLAKRPIHDEEPWLAATSWAVETADDRAARGLPAAADTLCARAAPREAAAAETVLLLLAMVVVSRELILSAAELMQRVKRPAALWVGDASDSQDQRASSFSRVGRASRVGCQAIDDVFLRGKRRDEGGGLRCEDEMKNKNKNN